MNRDLKEGPRSMEARYFDIGVVGRRTGITMKENVKKDADGLDNFDDFWDEGAEERRRTMVFGDTASEEDDLGGEEYYVSTPTSRQSKSLARGTASTPARAFLEQELPSELLSTPTSRRGKNAALYRASDPSDRVMEDYPSPSFNAVKKRLVFTKDAYDNDDDHDEYSGVASSLSSRIGANRGAIRSPALDKLLNASKEKKAQIQQNTSLSMSPMSPFRDTRKLPTVAPKSRSTTNTAAAATKAIVSAATTSTTSRATTGQRKAFDFGAEYSPVARQGGRSEDVQESRYAFSDDDGEEQDIFQSTTPPPRSKTGQTAKAVEASKTPAEFRRKQPAQGAKMVSATLPQKSAPAPKSRPAVQQYSEDDDQGYDNAYEEPDERDANEDRFQFSDEEDFRRLSRRYAQEEAEEDEEEEDEPLVRRNRATKETVPVQQKRTVGTEDSDTQSRSKLTATGSSRAKKDIPKATKKPQQRQPSKAKTAGAASRAKTTKNADILSEEDEVVSEDEDEEGGDGQVPNRSRSKTRR
ncbi:hypothetical protein EMPS_07295 [Entomortierella parvispora]|uniref:Mif2 N-terminal domain-containing protein n=1 Tax=Entomortierella parvispora TaxID=205924 RepID=A0A9P3HE30_9FUNG|nr:hypothetical protein EMPS_07295 [Entomortierella parvispora]